MREVSIQDGILLINNVPVKFTGMCRHDCDPALGSAVNEQVWRRDIELMKAANVNAIRTSHYPYGSGFYDLCDEMGMYVMDEMAACWTPTDTDELTPAFAQHAREVVRRDKNHASVVVWAIGKRKTARGRTTRSLADEIRKLDPTRPRLVSTHEAEEGGVEFDDEHYKTPAQIGTANKQARRAKFPILYLENPNTWEERNSADYGSLDLWAAVMDRSWKEIWADDHVPGSFLWEWRDRAICDQCSTKLFDYDPVTGINLVKVKGICDGFCNPRPWYFHVKMAYAPIKVDLTPKIQGAFAIVHATNHYSFTDLSELTTTWHLMQAGKDLESKPVHLALAPRSQGDLKLDLPQQALSQADVLKLEFVDAAGRNVANYQLRLKPEANTTPKLDTANLAGVNFPHLNLVPVTYGKNAVGWRWAFRHPGTLVNISVTRSGAGASPVKDDAALYAMPLGDVHVMEADVVQADEPNGKKIAHVRAEFANGEFSYQVNWLAPNGAKNAPADIQGTGLDVSNAGRRRPFLMASSGVLEQLPRDAHRPAGRPASPRRIRPMFMSRRSRVRMHLILIRRNTIATGRCWPIHPGTGLSRASSRMHDNSAARGPRKMASGCW